MVLISSGLLIISIVALSIGSAIDTVAQVLGIAPVVGRIVTWSISIVSTLLLFLLVYLIVPNRRQSWHQALPGALRSCAFIRGSDAVLAPRLRDSIENNLNRRTG
jgi:uncharacterized BrkB/YihY/UPF0761 family membrane protein